MPLSSWETQLNYHRGDSDSILNSFNAFILTDLVTVLISFGFIFDIARL